MCQALYYLVHRVWSKLRNSHPPQSQVFNKWKINWVHNTDHGVKEAFGVYSLHLLPTPPCGEVPFALGSIISHNLQIKQSKSSRLKSVTLKFDHHQNHPEGCLKCFPGPLTKTFSFSRSGKNQKKTIFTVLGWLRSTVRRNPVIQLFIWLS